MQNLVMRKESIILKELERAGYEAYFVGGCVRDAFMGRSGGDVDVATSAEPEEVKAVFDDYRLIETGIRHGTVTVMVEDSPVEITTYRSDGAYSDGRHPDKVSFGVELKEDLARRDFTVNAMALDLRGELTDPFGGRRDISERMLRTVGDPDKRFREDALRIMRGLRFASVPGFEIEEKTAEAMVRNRELLGDISAERIYVEFKKLLVGERAGTVLREYVDVIGGVFPEILAMKGFEQHNPYHRYDVLEHCIRAMEAVVTTDENVEEMKMAALFHDIGKPDTYFMDEEGIGHFYGHPKKSEQLVRDILQRMKADKGTLERVAVLVRYHDFLFDKDERLLKRWMNRLGEDVLGEILEIKLADNIATGNMSPELGTKFREIRQMMADILAEEQCFSLRDLAVSGHDLIAAGMEPGPDMGKALDLMLDAVIEERCDNDKDALMRYLKQLT